MSQIYAEKRKNVFGAQTTSKSAENISKSDMLRMSGAGAPQPMSASLRETFEPGFGADFSNIRISRGHIPEEMGVQAVAKGTDILVDSRAGMDVLGHELAHVVQQAQGRVEGGYPVVENAALEHEADVMGARVASGMNAELGGMSGMGGEMMSIAPMSGAEAPAQCKSKAEKQAEKAINNGNIAQSVMDAQAQDSANKSQAFDKHMERYNSSAGDSKKFVKDGGNVRIQRFLQRHMTGSEEENDALFKAVAEQGVQGMIPALKHDVARTMAWNSDALWDAEKGQLRSDEELMANPQLMADTIALNKDMHNFSDILKDGMADAGSLGMSAEEFDAFSKKMKLTYDIAGPLQGKMKRMMTAGNEGKANFPSAAGAAGSAPKLSVSPQSSLGAPAAAPQKKKGFFARLFGR